MAFPLSATWGADGLELSSPHPLYSAEQARPGKVRYLINSIDGSYCVDRRRWPVVYVYVYSIIYIYYIAT